jgi:hypothetical protein
MKIKTIILGSFCLHCLFFSATSNEASASTDPNGYIDDPIALDNGLLEHGDPNLTTYGFTPPINWQRIPNPDRSPDCYAGLDPNFIPPELSVDWSIPSPYQGDTFVVLSTGGAGDIRNGDIKSSTISQEVFLYPGDTIIGAYFFGTTDYSPYNDYASIYLELAADPNDYPDSLEYFLIPEAQCSVDSIGSFRSTFELSPDTGGWITFSHTVEPNQIGPYYLRCEVVDLWDTIYNTYFAIDGLRICRGGRSIADMDWDCDVDLLDYSIISKAWMTFCPDIPIDDPNFPGDPNDYPVPVTDPNIPCQLADLDNSWFVEPNDLIIFSDQWLLNLPSE